MLQGLKTDESNYYDQVLIKMYKLLDELVSIEKVLIKKRKQILKISFT